MAGGDGLEEPVAGADFEDGGDRERAEGDRAGADEADEGGGGGFCGAGGGEVVPLQGEEGGGEGGGGVHAGVAHGGAGEHIPGRESAEEKRAWGDSERDERVPGGSVFGGLGSVLDCLQGPRFARCLCHRLVPQTCSSLSLHPSPPSLIFCLSSHEIGVFWNRGRRKLHV